MSRKTFSPNEYVLDSDKKLVYGPELSSTPVDTAVTLGTNPTPLPTNSLSKRKVIYIFNNGSVPIYIGSSTVSKTTGFPIYPHGAWSQYLEEEAVVYGVADSGTADVRILEGA